MKKLLEVLMFLLKVLPLVRDVLPKPKGKNYSTEKYQNLRGTSKKIAQTFEEESFMKREYGINLPKKYYKKVLILADILDLTMEKVKELRNYIWGKNGMVGLKHSKYDFWFLFTARYPYLIITLVTLLSFLISVTHVSNSQDAITAIQTGGYFVIYTIISASINSKYKVVKLVKDNCTVVV